MPRPKKTVTTWKCVVCTKTMNLDEVMERDEFPDGFGDDVTLHTAALQTVCTPFKRKVGRPSKASDAASCASRMGRPIASSRPSSTASAI